MTVCVCVGVYGSRAELILVAQFFCSFSFLERCSNNTGTANRTTTWTLAMSCDPRAKSRYDRTAKRFLSLIVIRRDEKKLVVADLYERQNTSVMNFRSSALEEGRPGRA